MIRDPFDSNNDGLSMSDAMMGNLRAEMRHGRFSSVDDDNHVSQDSPPVSLGLIDYVSDSSIPLRRRACNVALWLVMVAVLFIVLSVGMTKLLT